MDFLSVVIPAYNENLRIRATLEQVSQFLRQQPYRWEILVVDDGSRDDTAKQVEAMAGKIPQLRLVRHPTNRGKGAAIRTGLKKAQGEAVLFCDADGATPIEDLHRLLPHLSEASIVAGSRRLPGSSIIIQQQWIRRWMSTTYQWLCRLLLVPEVSDVTCGFKLLSREAAQCCASRMRINRWSFDAEILTIAKLHHVVFLEIPVRWSHQKKTKVRLLRDVLGSFRELLQIRWGITMGWYQ